MYLYKIIQGELERSTTLELYHESKYTQEEFRSIVKQATLNALTSKDSLDSVGELYDVYFQLQNEFGFKPHYNLFEAVINVDYSIRELIYEDWTIK